MDDTDKMIDTLWRAKAMVVSVYENTHNDDVGNAMCSIDEAIGALEKLK